MANRTVIIAGASGLVGNAILEGLLADDSVVAVHNLARRKTTVQHPKLTTHVVDFSELPSLPHADEIYLALGTTRKVAGSQAAFRSVDYDANLVVATAALITGAKKVGLVSAMGANADSKVFYNRVKGELEDALTQMPFESVVIARPSLLIGNREMLGQPERLGEKLGLTLSKLLGSLIPLNYKPIAATTVAKALLSAVPAAKGTNILLSGSMQPKK